MDPITATNTSSISSTASETSIKSSETSVKASETSSTLRSVKSNLYNIFLDANIDIERDIGDIGGEIDASLDSVTTQEIQTNAKEKKKKSRKKSSTSIKTMVDDTGDWERMRIKFSSLSENLMKISNLTKVHISTDKTDDDYDIDITNSWVGFEALLLEAIHSKDSQTFLDKSIMSRVFQDNARLIPDTHKYLDREVDSTVLYYLNNIGYYLEITGDSTSILPMIASSLKILGLKGNKVYLELHRISDTSGKKPAYSPNKEQCSGKQDILNGEKKSVSFKYMLDSMNPYISNICGVYIGTVPLYNSVDNDNKLLQITDAFKYLLSYIALFSPKPLDAILDKYTTAGVVGVTLEPDEFLGTNITPIEVPNTDRRYFYTNGVSRPLVQYFGNIVSEIPGLIDTNLVQFEYYTE